MVKKIEPPDPPGPIYFVSLADLQAWVKKNTTDSTLMFHYDEDSKRYSVGLCSDGVDEDENDWCYAKTMVEAVEKLAAVVKARRPKGVRGLLNPAPKKGLRPV